MEEYLTLSGEGTQEFVERKSRFIGYVKPVETEQQAQEFIAQIKQKHWDATHNVSAYVLRSGQKRYSDEDVYKRQPPKHILCFLLAEYPAFGRVFLSRCTLSAPRCPVFAEILPSA